MAGSENSADRPAGCPPNAPNVCTWGSPLRHPYGRKGTDSGDGGRDGYRTETRHGQWCSGCLSGESKVKWSDFATAHAVPGVLFVSRSRGGSVRHQRDPNNRLPSRISGEHGRRARWPPRTPPPGVEAPGTLTRDMTVINRHPEKLVALSEISASVKVGGSTLTVFTSAGRCGNPSAQRVVYDG
jgi:hypothetical protein